MPKGRLFPLSRDELVEGLATVRSLRNGELYALRIPPKPLDVLAQQIVACVACEDRDASVWAFTPETGCPAHRLDAIVATKMHAFNFQ